MPALVHRDPRHEVRPQRARYELTCKRAGGSLNGLLRRQLRQLLRDQVVVLGELLQQVVRSRACHAVEAYAVETRRSPGLLHGELLSRQLMREQLQHRGLLLRVAELLRVTELLRVAELLRVTLADGCLLAEGYLLAERRLLAERLLAERCLGTETSLRAEIGLRAETFPRAEYSLRITKVSLGITQASLRIKVTLRIRHSYLRLDCCLT